MKRSIWSEKNLVILLFVIVIIVFSFAQADSNKLEKMFLENGSAGTTSPAQTLQKETATIQSTTSSNDLR